MNRETIDNEIRNNPEKANREYYNQFTQDAGANQIIKRALIVRNSYNRPPVLYNDTTLENSSSHMIQLAQPTYQLLVLESYYTMKKMATQWILLMLYLLQTWG